MFALLRKARFLSLPIDIINDLYDKMVIPILTYGAEVWGCKVDESVERFHRRFCKILLEVNKSTPNCMALGELGKLPIAFNCEFKLLSYWGKLICRPDYVICKLLYKSYHRYFVANVEILYSFDWISRVKELLSDLNLIDYWNNQKIDDFISFKNLCKDRLKSLYIDKWKSEVMNNRKCVNYRMFKNELIFEKYLINLPYLSLIHI